MNYHQALDYINNFINYEKVPMPPPSAGAFNLERVRRFWLRLGQPHQQFPALVVAGTKGKGSTALLMANALQAAGYRVGLYTQPHLHSYRERMRVNGQLISREELARLVQEMRPAIEGMLIEEVAQWGAITSYEVGTGLALLYFARRQVEIAVLEIGLGGRLDAVNVVNPLVSVITSLSLDHMAVLGNTIEQIAYEKGGIIKPGVPVISARQWPGAVTVLQAISHQQGAPLSIVEPARLSQPLPPLDPAHCWRDSQPVLLEFGPHSLEVKLGLLGEHQRQNAAVAAAALWQQQSRPGGLPLDPAHLERGFSAVEWPARLQVLEKTPGRPLIVADGAHNAESAARLRQALAENFYYEKLWLVAGAYHDKDLDGIFQELLRPPAPAGIILTRSRNPRATDPLLLLARLQGWPEGTALRLETSGSVGEGLQLAAKLAGPLDLICATGSLSVAAEAQEYLASTLRLAGLS